MYQVVLFKWLPALLWVMAVVFLGAFAANSSVQLPVAPSFTAISLQLGPLYPSPATHSAVGIAGPFVVAR